MSKREQNDLNLECFLRKLNASQSFQMAVNLSFSLKKHIFLKSAQQHLCHSLYSDRRRIPRHLHKFLHMDRMQDWNYTRRYLERNIKIKWVPLVGNPLAFLLRYSFKKEGGWQHYLGPANILLVQPERQSRLHFIRCFLVMQKVIGTSKNYWEQDGNTKMNTLFVSFDKDRRTLWSISNRSKPCYRDSVSSPFF